MRFKEEKERELQLPKKRKISLLLYFSLINAIYQQFLCKIYV